MKVYNGVDEFATAQGDVLGTTEWVVVDQARIDTFAQATGDHQWIHVDAVKAASGPFGATIAHGLLTLSLLPVLLHELYKVDAVTMAVNYGFDKVRFAAPVPVGSRVRASAVVGAVDKVPGGVQGKIAVTIEVEGSAKPAAVAESIVRFVA
ncbi:MaoC family dehydratase [Antrihabitans sp. YC2-6]|uniref:MaoC family dehydratase n=1 Tax=Antrihabitans sp. YC2-6 TaxID=2799498 RepID=UPI0018F2EF4C|nr:MaoC family dehydratase [Antrihabitans sp. YC2-6]MBJ8345149.1 MaoC family dehydratase [Antrihabitans sp. YC2-6]